LHLNVAWSLFDSNSALDLFAGQQQCQFWTWIYRKYLLLAFSALRTANKHFFSSRLLRRRQRGVVLFFLSLVL
jgi:hypothetical protein